MRIIIHGQIRGGKNNINITRTGHRYPNPVWAKWRNQVVKEISSQLTRSFKTIDKPCSAIILYYRGDLRRRDVPASLDSILHCLERANVVADDSLVVNVNWQSMNLDRVNPRAEIYLDLV